MNTEAAKTVSHSPLNLFMYTTAVKQTSHYMNSHHYSPICLILQTQHLKPHAYCITFILVFL